MGMVYCRGCGKQIHETAPTCPECGAPQHIVQHYSQTSGNAQSYDADANLVRQIADYERISGWLWIVLGVIQVISIVGVLAGVWNIYAGWTRLRIAPAILARKAGVPQAFESVTGLVIIGILNFVLGGVVGLICVGFDVFIRDKVLSNRRLFNAVALDDRARTAPAVGSATGGAD
ncbi:MAG: hypothetical protein P4L91_09905 [Burkholderiaceae bacterium]|nr:hypothetical protein [Burkholderiaceae bacterium]